MLIVSRGEGISTSVRMSQRQNVIVTLFEHVDVPAAHTR
jgi:hypothetical protein